MTDKVFLEIGTSNFDTLIPLVESGWQGYCVEPITEYVHDLLQLNQKVVLSNCAISSYNGMLKMYQSVSDNVLWSRGVSHAVEQQGEKILEYEQYNHLIKDTIEVPCYTLSSYIKRMGITSIDMLKVDTEGHEMDIFEAYDWSVKPTFMKVEHLHVDDVKLKKIFEDQGYIVYTEENDLYCVGGSKEKKIERYTITNKTYNNPVHTFPSQ
jgi:FkbM family methyltransferase